MKIECIWRGPNDLGEGPLWHHRERVLYWIDIANPSLHRLDPKTQEYRCWAMPDYIGAVVPRHSGGVIVTVGNRIYSVDIPSGKMTVLAQIEPWNDELRMNDGKCDRQGRFWIGVAHLDKNNPKGGLYRLDPDMRLTQMEQGITISNGLGFSPDDKTFYYTDGLKYRVYCYDFDPSTGTIYNRRVFVQLDESPIEPDGLCVDSQGYIWQAQWNGGCVVRYRSNGEIDTWVDLPVSRPTSCIFGGEDLNILYVTSCSKGLGEEKRLPPPSGGLFAVHVGVKGLSEPEFMG